MKKIRLDKYLSEMVKLSRAEVKNEIRKGHVMVNGEVMKKPECKVSDEDEVSLRGEKIAYVEKEYILFHKPAGCVSATEDGLHKTVVSYVDSARDDLFPVGRLDLDTEGLLLLTNDGELAHRLLSPKKKVPKTYYAKIRGFVTEEDCKKFAEGLDIGDEKPTMPAELLILQQGEESEIEVTITEGRFHEVKRMFEAVSKEVLYLKRLSMATLQLDTTLAPGEYRDLTVQEKTALFAFVGMKEEE